MAMKTKKWMGQHFLRNQGVVNRILDALEAEPGDRILEIGPGAGALTLPLNRRGFSLTAVEMDRELADRLRQMPLDPPITVVTGDFMDLPLDPLIPTQTKIVSNLPYNASVPITARLLYKASLIPLMVMMYQKEVAERIRARPDTKAYGLISILTGLFYEIDLHFKVGPGSFQPPPKVDSQVLRFKRRERRILAEADIDGLTAMLRWVFQHRRKTLSASLRKPPSNWRGPHGLLESLNDCGLDPGARPENLSPDQYVAWFQKIKERHDASSDF